jgi:hypothetical protein
LARAQAVPDEPERASGDAFVLRGGSLSGPSRELNLRRVHEAYKIWGICATSQAGLTAQELASAIRAGNRDIMTGLTQELREQGFDVIKEPGKEWPDALIVFDGEPGPEEWDSLQRLMSRRGRIPNPRYRGL